MSIMNMPPLPYLKRIPGLNTDSLHNCFTDARSGPNFDPGCLTLCSPDPQAIRMPDDKINVLTVTLPTNFKRRVSIPKHPPTSMRQMQREIEAIRFDAGDGMIDLPVKLKVHDSIFVPLAKWAMLCTGNYRCVRKDAAVTIKEACTPTSRRRAPSTTGCAIFASCWAHRRTIWCRSRNTPPRRMA